MLSRSFRTKLCQSCRNDLLALFENGVGSPSALRGTPLQTRWSHPSRSSNGTAVRDFSSKQALRDTSEDHKPPSDAHLGDTEANVVAQLDRARIEVIRQVPILPEVGDLDEYGREYTAERSEDIARHLREAQNAGVFESPEATALWAKPPVEADEKSKQDMQALYKRTLDARNDSSGGLGLPKFDGDEDAAGAELQDNRQQEVDLLNSIEAMRDSDASVEQVVREARQVHGEYLPDGVLSEDESRTYKRLYGKPLEGLADEHGIQENEEIRESPQLLDQDGEAITYDNKGRDKAKRKRTTSPTTETIPLEPSKSMKQRAMEVAEDIGGEIRPYEMDEATEEDPVEKSHPLTVGGRFQTSPRTIFLPQESFVQPVQKILSEYSNKHIKDMCERLFGGPGLPTSPLNPRIGRILPQTSIPIDASQHIMGTMEANAYVSAVWPSTFAAVTSILVETRKRLGSQWLRNLLARDGGPSVLDAGGGGVGILAWRDIITAEWKALQTSDASPPPTPLGRSTVLAGSDNLRYRAASLLENTTFLPRLPDYVHVRDSVTLSDDRPASQRKQFDVIIAPHTLWPLGEEWQRKQQIQNLWSLLNPEGGVLILVEKGVPRGFEVIAGARELLLSRYIATADSPTYESKLEASNEDGTFQKGKGMIIAPCTNHAPCPMYPVPGLSRGRKDYCSFQQRYIRPPFLQRILGAKDRNHDDVDFSYVAIQKGRDLQDMSTTAKPVVQGNDATDSAFEGYEDATDAEESARVHSLTLPRLVFHPLKRPGHVTIDLCTPAGKIDRWTVTKSFSKAAYRDARKANWGDLWALGAKTRVPRNLSLGGEKSKKGRSQNERMMSKAQSILDRMEEDKQEGREVAADIRRSAAEEDDAMFGRDDDDDDDFDADAAEVLKEMEQEQKTSELMRRNRQTEEKRRKGKGVVAAGTTGATPDGAAATNLKRPSGSTTKKDRAQEDDATPSSCSSSSYPQPQPQPQPHQPPPSAQASNLTPSEQASLADFAAESRVDRLKALSRDRLQSHSAKLRLRGGENKFRDPAKEKWREGVEGRKRKRKNPGGGLDERRE